jgi:hypothetical protein
MTTPFNRALLNYIKKANKKLWSSYARIVKFVFPKLTCVNPVEQSAGNLMRAFSRNS